MRQSFRLKALKQCYEEHVALTGGPGLDRVSPRQFHGRHKAELLTAYRKIKEGTYRFTPYLEKLAPKGRAKNPRVLSIPSVRDRVVLRQLMEALHGVFPDRVERTLPNQHVRSIGSFVSRHQGADLLVLRADIKGFYEHIDHSLLDAELRRRIRSERLLRLLSRTIKTPTVPRTYRRASKGQYVPRLGVPQGLAISNVLAGVYLTTLDAALRSGDRLYRRYVDDILIIGTQDEVRAAKTELDAALGALRLELNAEKTDVWELDHPFEFLGYRFEGPLVTVRRRTIDRFIDNLAARFTRFRERFDIIREERPWLSRDAVRQIFVDETNEAIAGAISEGRRYGWVFYFVEINDRSLLHQLDRIVRSFYMRSPFFAGVPNGVKRFVRAHYEAQYRPRGGYVLDYDRMTTLGNREAYLRTLGVLDPTRSYRPDEITDMFEREKRIRLARLDMDIGTIS